MLSHVMIHTSLLLLLLNALVVQAQQPNKAHLNISADAEIEVLPDYVQLHIYVEKLAKDTQSAKQHVDDISQQVLSLSKKMRISDKDIDASQISSQPYYEWQDKKRQLKGQQVKRLINIKLYHLQNYSHFVSLLMDIDIQSYQQVSFGFDDINLQQNKAIILALDQARIKAQLISQHSERKLGDIYAITTNSQPHYPSPRGLKTALAFSAPSDNATTTDLEIKPQIIKAKVNVIYLLK